MLLLRFARREVVEVGALGSVEFDAGQYAYVGSAMGRGAVGLRGRVARHARGAAKRRWHVDHVLASPACRLLEAWTLQVEPAGGRECAGGIECEVSSAVAAVGAPIRAGLGSSDCKRCEAHLYRLPVDVAAARALLWSALRPLGRLGTWRRADAALAAGQGEAGQDWEAG